MHCLLIFRTSVPAFTHTSRRSDTCSEESAKTKLPIFVLDRPNPIGGVDVEGRSLIRTSFRSRLTTRFLLRHGLTIGELAQLFNKQRNIGADLRVIKMEGWQRSMCV